MSDEYVINTDYKPHDKKVADPSTEAGAHVPLKKNKRINKDAAFFRHRWIDIKYILHDRAFLKQQFFSSLSAAFEAKCRINLQMDYKGHIVTVTARWIDQRQRVNGKIKESLSIFNVLRHTYLVLLHKWNFQIYLSSNSFYNLNKQTDTFR